MATKTRKPISRRKSAVQKQQIVIWLRDMACGPMARNPEHADTCNWLNEAAKIIEISIASRRRLTDAEIQAWANRHDFNESISEVRMFAEDIRSV